MAKKYYWLKLNIDFFDREEIKLIEGMPNGKDYIIFYMKLLLRSANNEGKLMFKDVIPYTDEMLATITNTNIDVVRSAVKMFIQLDMMEKLDDGALFMIETQNMIGCETEFAKKKREYKERLKVNVTPAELPNSYPYKLGKCEVLSYEQIRLPNGIVRFVDEKRYGGNGMIKLAKVDGKCEKCGSEENIVIHHKNGYNNSLNDLEILCKKCHGEEHARTMLGKSPSVIRQEIDKEIEIDKDIYIKKSVAHDEQSINLKSNIAKLISIAALATGLDKSIVMNTIKPANFKEIEFDLLFRKISESDFLQGKLDDRKPIIAHFTERNMLNKIFADRYKNKSPIIPEKDITYDDPEYPDELKKIMEGIS